MDLLKRKRVLVLGGSSGIGLAAAMAAAREGADVMIASRSADRLKQALTAIGGTAQSKILDVTDESGVSAFFAGTEPWNHIIVAAGDTPTGPARQLSVTDARRAMDSKFWGAYYVARTARFKPSATLTFVSGIYSVRPSAAAVLQGAINAALDSLARGLALELAPVRVNAVSPGLIDTPIWSQRSEDQKSAAFAWAQQHLPVHRVGHPNDIANAIMFLVTTPYATGSVVQVDGGATLV